MSASSLRNWTLAARPKTLWAGVTPVVIGTAMAFDAGGAHWAVAGVCLLAALSVQIGANLANDYFDFTKGADTPARLGPVRATQAGLIPPSAVKRGFIAAFAVFALCGLSMVRRGGWPVLAMVAAAVAAGILYTGGPLPFGYIGLGDVPAFIFFGPVAVGGTYYLQALTIDAAVIIAGLAPGLFAVAMLTVNNLRDIEEDRRSGKRTLAALFGRGFARAEFLLALLLAGLVPVGLYCRDRTNPWILLAVLVIPVCLRPLHTVLRSTDGEALNQCLASVGRAMLLYALLFSVGVAL